MVRSKNSKHYKKKNSIKSDIVKNKFFNIMMMSMAVYGLASCSHDLDSANEGTHRKPDIETPAKVYTLNLSFGGDFYTETDEALRSWDGNEGDTYVGINIFRTTTATQSSTKDNYAYGVFKYPANTFDKANAKIAIKLIEGYTYTVEATALTEMADKVKLDTNNGNCYSSPFTYGEVAGVFGAGFKDSKKNNLIYNYSVDGSSNESNSNATKYCLTELNSGTAYIDNRGEFSYTTSDGENAYSGGYFAYPRVKRYYGLETIKLENPSTDNTPINKEITMNNKSFGLKFEVEQLPAGCYITVEGATSTGAKIIKTSDDIEIYKYLTIPKTTKLGLDCDGAVASWERLYSINNFSADSEEFNFVFTVHKADGKTEKFYANNVSISPKTRKTIKLNFNIDGGTKNQQKAGNLTLKFDENVDNLVDDSNVVEVTENSTTRPGSGN